MPWKRDTPANRSTSPFENRKSPKGLARLEPPLEPAVLTVMDVLQAGTDGEKDAMIRKWMAAVWESWSERYTWIRMTTDELLAYSGNWGSGAGTLSGNL